MGPWPKGPALMVVIKYMAVIRITGSLWKYSWCCIRVGPWALGPTLMVVIKYMAVIRITGSL